MMLVTALLGGVAVWTTARAHRRHRASEAALRQLDAVRRDAAELTGLRARLPATDATEPQDLLALVRRAAEEARLPEQAVREIAPESDAHSSSTSGTVLRRRGLRVVLGAVSPRQVGEYIAAWRRAAPAWTLSTAQLDRRSGVESGYTARLTFSAVSPREPSP